jgi:hypothetical protein
VKPRVMQGTVALVALERGQYSIRKVHRLALELGYPIVATTRLARDYLAGRDDAADLLADLEGPQLDQVRGPCALRRASHVRPSGLAEGARASGSEA